MLGLYNNGTDTTVWEAHAVSDFYLDGEGVCGNYNVTGYTGSSSYAPQR